MFAGEMLDAGIEIGKYTVEVEKHLESGLVGHGLRYKLWDAVLLEMPP